MWGKLLQKRGHALYSFVGDFSSCGAQLTLAGSINAHRSLQQPFLRSYKTRNNRRKRGKLPIPKQPYKVHTGKSEDHDSFKPSKIVTYGEKIHGVPRSFQANEIDPEEVDDGEIGFESFLGEESQHPVRESVPFGEWTPYSVRTGAVGKKLGMLGVWDMYGQYRPLTVVQIHGCEINEVKKRLIGRRGDMPQIYLEVGAGDVSLRQIKKSRLCHFRKIGVTPKKKIFNFKITPDAILPAGTKITARHFVPGQYLDVISVSQGQGFSGAIKRHNFASQEATHGNSLSHRKVGSIGQCQDPGKVFKGKKMPGNMGNSRVYTRNNLLYKIDVERNLLYLAAHIPGPAGSMCVLKDAVGAQWAPENPPPFPTYFPEEDEEQVNEIVMDLSHRKDPMRAYEN